jgi:hypothetical protein
MQVRSTTFQSIIIIIEHLKLRRHKEEEVREKKYSLRKKIYIWAEKKISSSGAR